MNDSTNVRAVASLDSKPESSSSLVDKVDKIVTEQSLTEQSLTEQSLTEQSLAEQINVHTEKLDGRQRKITATIHIPYGIEHVWSVLTDYEGLADFIPSLKQSKRIEHPSNGIRIEQIGSESLLKLKFCARVVLDMVESFPHHLGFEMVEGDFKQFVGEWHLQPLPQNAGTELTYTLNVWPSRLMPVGMIEKRLCKGLQVNLAAIRQRVGELLR